MHGRRVRPGGVATGRRRRCGHVRIACDPSRADRDADRGRSPALGRPLRRAGRRDLRRHHPGAGRSHPARSRPTRGRRRRCVGGHRLRHGASLRAAQHPAGARYDHRTPRAAGRRPPRPVRPRRQRSRPRRRVSSTRTSPSPRLSVRRPRVHPPRPSLPAQMAAADCEALSFAPDRCQAVVEAALEDAGLAWANIEHVTIAKPAPDTHRRDHSRSPR